MRTRPYRVAVKFGSICARVAVGLEVFAAFYHEADGSYSGARLLRRPAREVFQAVKAWSRELVWS